MSVFKPQQSGEMDIYPKIILHCDTLYKIGIEKVLWEPNRGEYCEVDRG